jgi:hypothetical protein
MIDYQCFIDAFEPDRRSEYARQHLPTKAKPAIRTRTPEPDRRSEYACQHPPTKARPAIRTEPDRRSPLPSVREIDAALHVKYGTTRFQVTCGERSRGRP